MSQGVRVGAAEADTVQVGPGLYGVRLIDGAVGSRRVSLLRGWIEPGSVHAPHTHSCEEAVVFLTGKGVVRIDGKDMDVGAGDAVWIPSNTVHSTLNTGAENLTFVAAFADAMFDSAPADAETPATQRRTGRSARRNRVIYLLRRAWRKIVGSSS